MRLFAYGALIFLGTLVGGLIPTHVGWITEKRLRLGVALGAGLLLGMAFAHMIPEAAELAPRYFGPWLLAGFLCLLVFERFAMVHACDEKHCDYHTVGIAAFVGLAVHGLIEGAALASSMVVPHIGSLVLVAILSHKLPSGMALASILRLAGKSRGQNLWFILGVSASGPLGLAVSYHFITNETAMGGLTGALLSASAGTFLYIGACDLLPEMHRDGQSPVGRLMCFLLGVALSLLGGMVASH